MTAHAEPVGHAAGLVLGIDGGGSRCTAVLAEAGFDGVNELGRGHGGPANAVSAGFDAAAANVAAAVAAAFAAAARVPEPVVSACLGFAGAGRLDVRDRWSAWARDRHLADRLEVVPDGVSAFGSSGPPAWGLVVVSGTGSIVWGRSMAGDLYRCGGRGGLIGDEGSGYAVAIAGLRAAVRSADGWGPATALAEAATRRFAVADPTDLPSALAASGMTRGMIASFAPDVVGLAEESDAEARRIVAEAAADLGGQSLAVARRFDLCADEYPLRLTGGLLCHAPVLRDGLVAWLSAAGFAPASVTLVPDLALAAANAAARSA